MNEFMRNLNVLKEILRMIDTDTSAFLDGDEEILKDDFIIEYKGVKARIPLDFANINNAIQYGLDEIIKNYDEYIEPSDLVPPTIEFKNIEPIYTGGNIWCFMGALTDGTFFLASDFMDSFRILNEDPRGKEESWNADWQEEHLIQDIDDDKTAPIFLSLYTWLDNHKSECGLDLQSLIEKYSKSGKEEQ